MKIFFSILFIFFLLCTSFCYAQNGKHSLQIKRVTLVFHNKVGNEDMQLEKNYEDPFGENYMIRNFEYYISDIELEDSTGKSFSISKEIFLIDETDSNSMKISLEIPLINIKKIKFLLGVDSIKNVTGVQTGALDPYKGMFWTWNTGYISAKLEGTSTSAKTAGTYFTYHIGGYKKGEDVSREIELNLPQNIDQQFSIININADANKWFNTIHEIKIAESPICHSPGQLAMKIADNYALMFSIGDVK